MSNEVQALQLADFMDLFAGNTHNYGAHEYRFIAGAKEAGKNSTITNKLLTIEQYTDHLNGKMGLGVIPIDEKGEVRFAAIDIDVYDNSVATYIEAIIQQGCPLVPFKSKSGGIHLVLFLTQSASAKTVIDLLKEIIAIFGLDIYIKQKLNRIIEVFPKQAKLAPGAAGSWINLPYYNAGNTVQCAIREGKDLSLNEALVWIKEKRISLGGLQAFVNEIVFRDAPPCLQTMYMLNNFDKNSGRNNYLFSFAVYLKKANPEFWEQQLFEINENMSNPLSKDEVEGTIVNSLRKKDYAYKCFEQPCVDFCRKALCKTREFGVGKADGYFSELEFGQLVQMKTNEPYYEWQVRLLGSEQYSNLRFKNEQDIIGQDAFLRLCFRELHTLPFKLKQSEWFKLINQALSALTITEVEKEDDTAPISLFKSLFIEFLTGRAMAQTKEQILNKRVYIDKDKASYYFRAVDFIEFLYSARNFRFYAPTDVHGLLRDFKAEPIRIKTESGKQFRVYSMHEHAVGAIQSYSAESFKAEFTAEGDAF